MLAAWCDEHAQPKGAAQVRAWIPPRDSQQLVFYTIDDSTRHLSLSNDASADEQHWVEEFTQLRRTAGAHLCSLGEAAVAQGEYANALQLLTAAVYEDPDHVGARRALGYELVDGACYTKFGRQMHDSGQVWHPRFGWIASDDVARYEQGERRVGNRWVSAAEDAAKRKSILAGWQVRTEHYLVTTDHSLEAGVALAARLEQFYQVWRQLFVTYYASPGELKRLLDGNAMETAQAKPHEVVLFRDKDEYVRELRSAQPQIDKTIGIYFDTRRRAYFFVGEENYDGNLYHEATHQLFQETRRTPRNVGREHNFWIVEGIAVYFETLTEHAGYATLGGPDAGRMPAARERLLKDDYYVPFAQLTALGTADIQRDPHIAKLYSQAAGQTAFLMQADGGQYQDALVRYIEAVYANKAAAATLAELTGATYTELDRQYRTFVQSSSSAPPSKDAEP